MALASEMMDGGWSATGVLSLLGGVQTIVAAGNSQATGTTVTATNNFCSTADGTKGVTLPLVQAGESVFIFNNSGSTLKVYPPVGGYITVPGTGIGTQNAAYSQLTYKPSMYICLQQSNGTGQQWMVITSA